MSLKKIIVTTVISLVLTSCVVSYTKEWTACDCSEKKHKVIYDSVKSSTNRMFFQKKNLDSIPDFIIKIHRNISFIPTFPLMFQIQTQKYGLELWVENHKESITSFDSIKYAIFDSTKNAIAIGLFVMKENFYCEGNDSFSSICNTYHTINMKPNRNDVIKGVFTFYITDIYHKLKVFEVKNLKFEYTGRSGIYSFF